MQKKNWISVLTLVFIAAIAYLPLISKIGYLNDDWYLMYDGYVGGASFFHTVFSVDRPLRGYLMQAAFSLFGMNPLYFHLSAFVFRVLSGIGLLWLCNQLWPKRETNNLLAAILFLVYPGFLSQINPIDYQSQIFSLACGMFSVALTVKAIQTKEYVARWVYMVSSIVLGWIYLGLVEYFIGFEVLRVISVGLLFWRDPEMKISSRLSSALRAFLPFMAGVGGFLIWRLFFFEAERKATDVGLQLSSLFTSPLTGLWWLNYLIQDVFKVTIVAWSLPLNSFAFSLRLRDSFLAFSLAISAVVVLKAAFHWGEKNVDESGPNEEVREMRERLWVALSTLVAGLVPVILVNRHVVLPEYSRYTLASSVGVAILLAIIIEKISTPSLKLAVASLFVTIAVLTHYGNSARVVNETAATRNFWWQVAWRAPQIKQGVTLIASYPESSLSEDYSVWGPANLIFYPEKQNVAEIKVKLPAAVLNNDAILQISALGGVETPLRRGNYLERDFDNILLMVQTVPGGCVRFIDGASPEISSLDSERLMLISSYSQLESVEINGEFHTPPSAVFGEEPEHGWCYYYEKADLARQRGEWKEIPVLLKKALAQGEYPQDGLEWMPFLQASAVVGDLDQVRTMSKLVSIDRFMRLQSCDIMTDFMKNVTVNEEIAVVLKKNICK